MQSWIRRTDAPVTLSIAALLAIGSLVFFFLQGAGMLAIGASVDWIYRPWVLLTYPFSYSGVGGIGALLFAVFMLAWMIYSCGSIEREIGTAKYLTLWGLFTIVPAIVILETMRMMGSASILMGPYLPIAAFSVAWATRNQHAQFNLWGVIPLTGKWIGILVVAGTFFQFGLGAPLVGVAACFHLGLSWLLASKRIPFITWQSITDDRLEKRTEERELAFRGEVFAREKEREEKERLRRLFERSGIDDK